LNGALFAIADDGNFNLRKNIFRNGKKAGVEGGKAAQNIGTKKNLAISDKV
jgi:hypothetical protein